MWVKLTAGVWRGKGRNGGAYREDTATVGWNCITDRTAGAGFITEGAKGVGFGKPTGNMLLLVELEAGRSTCTY